jgi:hypothetical protein
MKRRNAFHFPVESAHIAPIENQSIFRRRHCNLFNLGLDEF